MISGLVSHLLHSKYYQVLINTSLVNLPEGRLMIQLNLFIDVDNDTGKVLDDVLKMLKDMGIIANGSVKDMDGKIIRFIVNGHLATHLFANEEVDDGNNGDDSESEEFTQLDLDGIIASVRADYCNGHDKSDAGGT